MTESEWLASEDPAAMMKHLTHWRYAGDSPGTQRAIPLIGDRKLRLFACAAYRGRDMTAHDQGWPVFARIADAAERWADSEAGRNEVIAAGASDSWLVIDPDVSVAVRRAIAEYRPKAALLRDIVGNPFRPVVLPCNVGCRMMTSGRGDKPHHCHTHGKDVVYIGTDRRTRYAVCPDSLEYFRATYCTPAVLSLAQAAYEERQAEGTLDPARLAVLSDALEEAGCPAEQSVAVDVHVAIFAEPPHGWTVQVSGKDLMPKSPRVAHRDRRREAAVAWAEKNLAVKLERKGERAIWGGGKMTLAQPHPLLQHLRSPSPHVRGCWALDLLLGKE